MKPRPISTRIPENLYGSVKKISDRDGLKLQAVMRQALELWVAAREGKIEINTKGPKVVK